MSTFINLFDKPLQLVHEDGSEVVLPASGAPLSLSFTESTQTLNGMPYKIRTPNNPLILNLPEVIEGVDYLVPSWAASMANRPDFIVAFAQPVINYPNLIVKNLFRQE